MQTYSHLMLEAFEKEYGNLADFNSTKQDYFKLVKAFSLGWRAGQSFQQGVQRTANSKANIEDPRNIERNLSGKRGANRRR